MEDLQCAGIYRRDVPVSGHTNDMLERIERCERELQALRGYTKALESGLHAVILFSP